MDTSSPLCRVTVRPGTAWGPMSGRPRVTPASVPIRSDCVHPNGQHGVRGCSRCLHDPPQRTRHHDHAHLPALAVLPAHRGPCGGGAEGQSWSLSFLLSPRATMGWPTALNPHGTQSDGMVLHLCPWTLGHRWGCLRAQVGRNLCPGCPSPWAPTWCSFQIAPPPLTPQPAQDPPPSPLGLSDHAVTRSQEHCVGVLGWTEAAGDTPWRQVWAAG